MYAHNRRTLGGKHVWGDHAAELRVDVCFEDPFRISCTTCAGRHQNALEHA